MDRETNAPAEHEAAYVEGRAREIVAHLAGMSGQDRERELAGALWFSSAHCRRRIEARIRELLDTQEDRHGV